MTMWTGLFSVAVTLSFIVSLAAIVMQGQTDFS
jgi:hypothetical protein